ncbi:MAG: hypothetical protein LWX01_06695 [Deltaproteobacteria bacterium]|nr:hypothetical protein [Deltaproteobacteria bacterium]MDL1961375.1 hypothetical protein [Deltaproteobacteria bacterium]
MPRKKICKSEKLPQCGTPLRAALISVLTNTKDYQENLNKGFPLFNHEELENIKKHYKDGLVWDDIERELFRKKIILKKATFRKYIQENNLPKAKSYRNIDRRRLAVFPNDIISHINFLQYFYKVADGKMIDHLLNIVLETQITYLEAIESKLDWTGNLYAAICKYLGWDDAEAYEAIKETLSTRQKDQQKALGMLEEIDKKFKKIIDKDISKLISFLKEKHISPLEITDDKK